MTLFDKTGIDLRKRSVDLWPATAKELLVECTGKHFHGSTKVSLSEAEARAREDVRRYWETDWEASWQTAR